MTRTLGVLATLSFILLQSGCAMVRTHHGPNEASVAVSELVKSSRSWDGKLLPAYPEGQPEVTIRRIVIPAGSRLDPHRHPVVNAGVLISGQLTVVTANGQTLHLEAGDAIVELVNTVHYGINQGKDPAEIVVFYAGAVGMPITSTALRP